MLAFERRSSFIVKQMSWRHCSCACRKTRYSSNRFENTSASFYRNRLIHPQVRRGYAKWGENEMLFPSGTAVYAAKETLSMDAGVRVITDDASRNVRKYILDCVTTGAASQFGCH